MVLDLVGFWFPFFISADIVIVLGLVVRRHKTSRAGLARYVGLVLWISIFSDVLFQYSPDRINLTQNLSLVLILVSTFSYGVLFYRKRTIIESVFECYVIGVYAEILTDFARSYIIVPPLATVYWGGAGMNDLIFTLGYYMAMAYVPSAVILSVINSLGRRNPWAFIQKLIGKRAVDWLSKKYPQPVY